MPSCRLLVVEDQPNVRRLVRLALSGAVFEVHEAGNGEEGLERVRELRPEVVVLDVMMPGAYDGYQVCRAIRADGALAHIGVLMLTARGQAADIRRGEEAGADVYVVKPFSPDDLLAKVGELADLVRRRSGRP
jgi:DNA-binding response OmpR family regulator